MLICLTSELSLFSCLLHTISIIVMSMIVWHWDVSQDVWQAGPGEQIQTCRYQDSGRRRDNGDGSHRGPVSHNGHTKYGVSVTCHVTLMTDRLGRQCSVRQCQCNATYLQHSFTTMYLFSVEIFDISIREILFLRYLLPASSSCP